VDYGEEEDDKLIDPSVVLEYYQLINDFIRNSIGDEMS
jgi:hypothetical protein